jgi:hypothetical protein
MSGAPYGDTIAKILGHFKAGKTVLLDIVEEVGAGLLLIMFGIVRRPWATRRISHA